MALSVIKFNDGSSRLGEVVREMGCTVGDYMLAGLEAEDRVRVYYAQKKSSVVERSERKRRRIRKGLEKRLVEQESTTYGAGEF